MPNVKKGKEEKVEQYRVVTLMPSLHKIYAVVERLRIEMEGRELLSGSQEKQGSGKKWEWMRYIR